MMKYVIYGCMVTVMLLLTGCADAGDDQHVKSGDAVTLDGTRSTPDVGGNIISYQWKQVKHPSAITVTLVNPSTATPTFMAPDVDTQSEFVFKLKTIEHYACKQTGNNQQQCRKNATYDLVSIFVEPSDDIVTGSSITGTISDFNNVGILGATVSIGDQTAMTDANGAYRIDAVNADNRVIVNVTHPDYLSNSRIITVEDRDVSLDIKLGAPQASHTFLSSTGAVVSHDGAMVELPANGYVDGNGTAYNGNINVMMHYYPITTHSGRAAFPGTFEGIDGNETFPIQSFGFMNVELHGSQGEILNLAPGSTATLTFPRDFILADAPSSIPLWYYDADLGYWVQEGKAIQTRYNAYSGIVSHFTAWNLDAKGLQARLNGCVEDANGTRIEDAKIHFSSENWDSRVVPTDANGNIEVFNILAQKDLVFSASKQIGTTWFYGEFPTPIHLVEGENKNLTECIVLQEASLPNGTITVNGSVMLEDWFTEDSTPASSGRIQVYTTTGGYALLAEADVHSDGSFVLTFQTADALHYNIVFNGTDSTGNFEAYYYGQKTLRLLNSKSTYNIGILYATSELG